MTHCMPPFLLLQPLLICSSSFLVLNLDVLYLNAIFFPPFLFIYPYYINPNSYIYVYLMCITVFP